MATPDAEETIAPTPTAEAVVKTAEAGEKAAPKPAAAEEPSAVSTEKTTATEAATPAAEDSTEAAPVEEATVPFTEESNVVADLKDSEKKALEEFKARIVKAIAENEFKVPKKVVEAPKEPEVVETPKEAEAPIAAAETPASAETPAAETPAVETPAAAEAPAAETPAVETPAAETKVAETPAAETKVVETPAAETPAPEAPKVEEAKEAVVPPAEPAAESEPAAGPAATKEEAPVTDEPTPVVEAKDAAASVEKSAATPVETPAVEEEEEDLTPPEDVSLWGVPLLPAKGDERTDVILLKFLRARDFDVAQAFEQLKKTIIWRKTFKADKLLEEDFGTDFDAVAFDYGKDKDGHPVCYNVYAPFQDKELFAKAFGDSAKRSNFIRWRIQVLEKSLKLLSFSPEGPSALVQITDLNNAPGPGKKEVRSAYNQAVTILQDNYPELVVKQVFVNVPWYFNALYAFLSPFLTARSKSKFSRYTPGRTTEGLLKFVSADNIPVAYGGLSKPNDLDFSGVEAPPTELTIKAGEKATIELQVDETSGTVVWDLAVVGYEVNYGAEYVPKAELGYTTIIAKTRKLLSTTEEEPVRGKFKISEPGKVVITIDNAARKKKIAIYRYAVQTLAAETEVS